MNYEVSVKYSWSRVAGYPGAPLYCVMPQLPKQMINMLHDLLGLIFKLRRILLLEISTVKLKQTN